MPRVGYLTLTKEQTGRRDFLKAGSLGFLGLHLSQFLATQSTMAATTVNQPKPKTQSTGLYSNLAGRRPEPHRYLGPEAKQ